LDTQRLAKRAGIEYGEAEKERIAGVGLFGEKGFEDIQKRLSKNLRDGGKQLQADLETIGLKPGEAPPTPVEFVRRAAARREELEAAVKRGDEGAQAMLNEWRSAMERRAGPIATKTAETYGGADLQARLDTAEKTADAFRSKTEPEQLQAQAQAGQAALEEQKGIWSRAWTAFGQAAGPGVTNLTKEFSEGARKNLPILSSVGGETVSFLSDVVAQSMKLHPHRLAGWAAGLFAPTPAAAAELQVPPAIEKIPADFLKAGEEGGLSAKEMIEEGFDDGAEHAIEQIKPDFIKAGEEGGLSAAEQIQEGFEPAIERVAPDFLKAGEEGGLSAAEKLEEGFPAEDIGAAIAAGIQREPPDFLRAGEEGGLSAAEGLQEGFDVSEISAAISAAGSELGSTAAAGITEAGSSGGQAFGSSAEAGINAAGSAGGTAFSGAAQSGITAAGSAGGAAFASAINPGAIGSAIGSAAAAAISAAKVNVNVNVAGAGGGGASTGKDSAT